MLNSAPRRMHVDRAMGGDPRPERGQRAVRATSATALFLHLPKRADYPACQQGAKAQTRPCKRRGGEQAAKFGRTITTDQTVTLTPEAPLVEGHANALVFMDFATGWVECQPIGPKNEEDTMAALQYIVGPKASASPAVTGPTGSGSLAA